MKKNSLQDRKFQAVGFLFDTKHLKNYNYKIVFPVKTKGKDIFLVKVNFFDPFLGLIRTKQQTFHVKVPSTDNKRAKLVKVVNG